MDDAAPAAATPHFRTTQFHGIHAIALKTNIANGDGFTRQFFLG